MDGDGSTCIACWRKGRDAGVAAWGPIHEGATMVASPVLEEEGEVRESWLTGRSLV